jgi:hypothetical protein
VGGRAFHSSTLRLNVSTVCGIRWVVSVTKAAQVELRSERQKAGNNGLHSSTFQLDVITFSGINVGLLHCNSDQNGSG